MKFPEQIIPKTKYRSQIDFNKLFDKIQVYVLRRSDLSPEDTFNDLGNLRSDAITPKELPFMSLNLLGGLFEKKHALIKIGKEGSKKWQNNEKVYLSDYINGYEILNNGCSIFIDANSIHNQYFPYSQPTTNKELKKEIDKFFQFLPKPEKQNDMYHFQGLAKLVHDPTMLNYWHVEYNIIDFKGEPVKNKKANYIEQLCIHVLTNIICINSHSSIDEISTIPEVYYRAS